MASNVENTKKTSKLSKKDITMLGIRSSLLQSAFSYERMQAGGWAFAQVPIWKKFLVMIKRHCLKPCLIIWNSSILLLH